LPETSFENVETLLQKKETMLRILLTNTNPGAMIGYQFFRGGKGL
jgi:hypothetical protein